MELVADALLIAGALGAAFYCRTLARRLGALKDLDSGLGAAIAALSRQVDEMRASLDAAKSVSGDQSREIAQLTARAEMAAGRLELLLASLHEGNERRPLAPRTAGRTARRDDLRSADPHADDPRGDDEGVLTTAFRGMSRRTRPDEDETPDSYAAAARMLAEDEDERQHAARTARGGGASDRRSRPS